MSELRTDFRLPLYQTQNTRRWLAAGVVKRLISSIQIQKEKRE
jgi:hypothetical protein